MAGIEVNVVTTEDTVSVPPPPGHFQAMWAPLSHLTLIRDGGLGWGMGRGYWATVIGLE